MMSKSRKRNRAKDAGEAAPGRSVRVFGQRLSALRLARGWTQLEAAERAGISERLIRKAEASQSLGLRSIAILANLYSTAQSPLSLLEIIAEPLGAAFNEAGIEAIARRWHNELWNRGRLEMIAELAADDCVLHAHDKHLRGHAAVRRYIQSARAAMGTFKLFAQSPTIFGDLAVTRWRMWLQSAPSPVANRSHEKPGVIRGSTWIRVSDGQLCEAWKYWHLPFPLAEAPRSKA